MSILSQFKQSQNTDFPNVRPSLDLRFALAKKLDPRITFTRGSIGTYFGSDGLMRTAGVNEPRFDHDPITGQSLGLLIEESRSNSLLRSEDFTTTWGASAVSVSSNVITAPDGNTTADKLVENTSFSSFKFVSQSVGTIVGTYTVSAFFKAGERFSGYVQLLSSGGNATALFNLRTGTITGGSGTITPYGNGWYRVSSTATFTSATATVYIVLFNINGITNYTGDGTSGIYVWGAQVETGAFPTSYIPTTASTVTRSADNASMTGTNFSSWYNSSEGTLYANAAPSTNGAYNGHVYLLGTDFNNGITYYRQSDYQAVIRMRSGQRDEYSKTINNAVGYGTIWRNAVALKSVFAFKTNDFNSFVSGVSANGSRATAGTLPTFTGPLYLGGLNGSNYLNGTISRLTYYPIQLTNQQLINLTS